MKLLLRCVAAILAAVSLIALISPATLGSFLGMPLDLDPKVVLWSIRVAATCALVLAAFLALGASFFPERALRQSGGVLCIFILLITVLLIIAPVPWVTGRVLLLAAAALVSLATVRALRARLRNR